MSRPVLRFRVWRAGLFMMSRHAFEIPIECDSWPSWKSSGAKRKAERPMSVGAGEADGRSRGVMQNALDEQATVREKRRAKRGRHPRLKVLGRLELEHDTQAQRRRGGNTSRLGTSCRIGLGCF